MSEHEPNEQSELPEGEDASPSAQERPARPSSLTPEQRRLLGKPRPLHERVEAEQRSNQTNAAESGPGPQRERETRTSARQAKEPLVETAGAKGVGEEGVAQRAAARRSDNKSSSRSEMQHAALIIGALLILFLTFYVGKKFDYLRYLLLTRNQPKLNETVPSKFNATSADELIEQALTAERSGNWHDAAERLIAAKYKNLKYPGILFRVGKLAYDHGDFNSADRLFERAIAFGENAATANYFRGLLATRHRDLPAAERFFEAAANADPFTPDYYYYWGEALRMDHHPQEAIVRYQQAEHRARTDQDAAVCRFKVRMARIEAGDVDKLNEEIQRLAKDNFLTVDWLMTDAAVKIRGGKIDEALRRIYEARAGDSRRGLFLSCASDALFDDASKKRVEIAMACGSGTSIPTPLP